MRNSLVSAMSKWRMRMYRQHKMGYFESHAESCRSFCHLLKKILGVSDD